MISSHRRRCSISSAPGPAPPERAGEEPGLHQVVTAEHEVVDHVQVGEQPEVLERPGHAELRRCAAGRMPTRFVPSSRIVPGLRPVHAVQAVEDRRLAGAVGTDDREQLAVGRRRSVTSVSAVTPPKRSVHVASLEQRTATAGLVPLRHRIVGSSPLHRFLRR